MDYEVKRYSCKNKLLFNQYTATKCPRIGLRRVISPRNSFNQESTMEAINAAEFEAKTIKDFLIEVYDL